MGLKLSFLEFLYLSFGGDSNPGQSTLGTLRPPECVFVVGAGVGYPTVNLIQFKYAFNNKLMQV